MGSVSSKCNEKRSGSCLLCSTPLGQIQIQAFGPEHGPVIVALHGMSSATFVIREWDSLAVRLAAAGYRVLLPNFHSNAALAPRLVSTIDMNPVLKQILEYFHGQQVVLMGKSWGGAVAAKFAARHPALVKQLVLVCPALPALTAKKTMLRELNMPLLLLWAKDDWVTWFSCSQVFCENCPRICLRPAERGGHRVLPEYAEAILNFLPD